MAPGTADEAILITLLKPDWSLIHSYFDQYHSSFWQEGVGSVAINDSFYVEACIYKVLKRFISHQPYYVQVMELFHEVCKLVPGEWRL